MLRALLIISFRETLCHDYTKKSGKNLLYRCIGSPPHFFNWYDTQLANSQLKTAASLLAIQRYAAQAHYVDHVVVSFRNVTQRSPFLGGMLRDIPKTN